MTRDEYIQQQLNLAKEKIRSDITANGKKPEDWDSSFSQDSIFPEIFVGMISDSYGAIWDMQQEFEKLKKEVAPTKEKLNELIRFWNSLIYMMKLYNVIQNLGDWGNIQQIP